MTRADEGLKQENDRLHLEIRALNGQVDGLTRAMAGAHDRIAKLQRRIAELESGEEAA